jgi:hypothetical protein
VTAQRYANSVLNCVNNIYNIYLICKTICVVVMLFAKRCFDVVYIET